jgi:hypothetical protein
MPTLMKSHLCGDDIYESKKPQKMSKQDYHLDGWEDTYPTKPKKPTGRFLTKNDLKSYLDEVD